MNTKELLEYCLAKNGAYIDYPFTDDYPVVKVKSSDKTNQEYLRSFIPLTARRFLRFQPTPTQH